MTARADGRPKAKRRPVSPRPCAACGEVFQPVQNRSDKRFCSMACYDVARRSRKVHRTCAECGKAFTVSPSTALRAAAKYCSRACYFKNPPRPSLQPAVADKISAAKTTTGKKTGVRRRQLEHAGFTLAAKGEKTCRNCGNDQNLNLHHAIPRSMWKAGITEPLNGIPLCVTCHMGWHHRRLTIYRDVFRPEEWACLLAAELLGQDVSAWLDDRYPVRP